MKTISWKFLFLFLIIISGCQQKVKETGDHEHDATSGDVVETSGNQELYNQVMKIHDEVMPKMENIHRSKQELKEKISKNPKITEVERIKIDALIAKLDSAGEGMMIWMREFRPIPDSLGEEKAREYLENEMERVKRVRENIIQALNEAREKK